MAEIVIKVNIKDQEISDACLVDCEEAVGDTLKEYEIEFGYFDIHSQVS